MEEIHQKGKLACLPALILIVILGCSPRIESQKSSDFSRPVLNASLQTEAERIFQRDDVVIPGGIDAQANRVTRVEHMESGGLRSTTSARRVTLGRKAFEVFGWCGVDELVVEQGRFEGDPQSPLMNPFFQMCGDLAIAPQIFPQQIRIDEFSAIYHLGGDQVVLTATVAAANADVTVFRDAVLSRPSRRCLLSTSMLLWDERSRLFHAPLSYCVTRRSRTHTGSDARIDLQFRLEDI